MKLPRRVIWKKSQVNDVSDEDKDATLNKGHMQKSPVNDVSNKDEDATVQRGHMETFLGTQSSLLPASTATWESKSSEKKISWGK